MMILELVFTDSPQRLAARPAHREVLLCLQEQGLLLGAGPWADDSGALLIFDTHRAALERIMAADPYYGAEGVQIASVREWTPVIAPRR